MPGRRPVDESTIVHVLPIDTFTHSGFYQDAKLAPRNQKSATKILILWDSVDNAELKGNNEQGNEKQRY